MGFIDGDISDSVRSYSYGSNTVRKYDSSASNQCKDSFEVKEQEGDKQA